MASPSPAAPQSTGLPPGVEVGGLGQRFVAALIDRLVPGILGGAAGFLAPMIGGTGSLIVSAAGGVLALAWAVFVWWGIAVRAASPGMRLMHLQLVGFFDGRPVGWGRALLRSLILLVLSATGIGLVIMLILLLMHPRKQGWHDLVAKAVVIKARPLAPPRPKSGAGPAHQSSPQRLDPMPYGAVPQPTGGQPGGQFGFPPESGSQGGQPYGSPVGAGGPPAYGNQPGGAPAPYGNQSSPPAGGQPYGGPAGAGSPNPYGGPSSAGSPNPYGGPSSAPSPTPVQPLVPPPGVTSGAPSGGPYGGPAGGPFAGRPADSGPAGGPFGGPPDQGQFGGGPAGGPFGGNADVPFGATSSGPAGSPAALVPPPGVAPTGQPAFGGSPNVPSSPLSGPDAELGMQTTLARPAQPAPTPPAAPVASDWLAVLDDGREVSVNGTVLIGRNPSPQPGEEDAQLIKIADETRTVSKSHLAIGIDAGGPFVVDRGSTNGSTVTTSSGVSTRCRAGETVRVTEGTIVSIGDHWLEIRKR